MNNPRIWSFLSGGRKAKEKYIDTAYREITEESGIRKNELKCLYHSRAMILELRKKEIWPNELYIFRSKTSRVRLDLENSKYRWGTVREIENGVDYTNVFINEKRILTEIKAHINE